MAAKDEFSRDGLKPGVRRPQPNESRPSVIPGEPPLQNLIVPAQSTIGTQLLKAMGWREGEGVGPKVIKYPARPHGSKIRCAVESSPSSSTRFGVLLRAVLALVRDSVCC